MRLTERDGNNVWFAHGRPRGFFCPQNYCDNVYRCNKVNDRTCPYLLLLDKLAAYEDAEEQGRLVILPKTLYEANTTPLIMDVIEWEVTGVRYYDGTVQAYTVQTNNVNGIIYGDEIGKDIFLTYKEAEAALKGESDK